MTKRRITILLAGALFATGSGMAGAHGNAGSLSDQSRPAPVYQGDASGSATAPQSAIPSERSQAPMPGESVNDPEYSASSGWDEDSLSLGDNRLAQPPSPAIASGDVQSPWLEQRSLDAVPPSDDLRGQQPLPSQQQYFAEKEQRMLGAMQLPDRTIAVGPGAESITVAQPSLVRFVDPAGHSFVLNTSNTSEGAVPLRAIAPPEFIAGDTMVYIRNPEEDTAG